MGFTRVNELKMIKSAVSEVLNATFHNKCWRLVDQEKTLDLMQIMIVHGPHYVSSLICISVKHHTRSKVCKWLILTFKRQCFDLYKKFFS